MVSIFLFDIAAVLLRNHLENSIAIGPETFQGSGETRFHFLNTGNSDCILIESEGRFALIDSGWGSNNPIAAVRRPGFEQRVIDYLKRVASDENGIVHLDFVLPTHFHYDHAGGFLAIFSDPAIQAGRVYLSPRTGQASRDVLITRQAIAQAAIARDFYIEENLPDMPFPFGAMTLHFLNTEHSLRSNENDRSIVMLAEYGEFRALLTGDIYANRGLEREIARQVGGPVDLLKLPHHGYTLSTSAAFLRMLRPKLAIVTNDAGKVYPNVMWNLTLVSRTPYLSTVLENGIIVTVGKNYRMIVTGDLHLPET